MGEVIRLDGYRHKPGDPSSDPDSQSSTYASQVQASVDSHPSGYTPGYTNHPGSGKPESSLVTTPTLRHLRLVTDDSDPKTDKTEGDVSASSVKNR